jgi:nitronate monooxygenase
MAGIQDATMAAAISNAGGLGSLPCAMFSPEALIAEVSRLVELTDAPFNLNFFCHSPTEITTQQQARWLTTLARYFAQLNIDVPESVTAPTRQPFNEDALAVVERFRPAVVSSHFGLPRSDWVQNIRSWGTKVLCTATTVEEACWLSDNGADVVIAQGVEAGGHRGCFLTTDMTTQFETLSLLPRICEKISLPVIAAGGIASPEDVVAAMTAGAAGVQAGTAFLLCPEANTSHLHRAALSNKACSGTALTNVFIGRPARSIVNRLVREVGPMALSAPPFPTAANAVTILRRIAESRGSTDFTPLWCGQNTTKCREAPAAEVLRWLNQG